MWRTTEVPLAVFRLRRVGATLARRHSAPTAARQDSRAVSRTTFLAVVGGAALALGLASPAVADPISLRVPQATAFAGLGHSCGGSQEQSTASGFDPVSGE